MNIADVNRLAVALGIPTIELLDASLSLSENLCDRHAEGLRELPEIHHSDVPIPA